MVFRHFGLVILLVDVLSKKIYVPLEPCHKVCLYIPAETESGIFRQILHGKLDFESDPWPCISDSAKDLIRKMLQRDPKKRITAYEALCE